LWEIVAARLLRGLFGAALVPLSQAVLLDINPKEKIGQAMAIWGAGIMIGPILGPMLGGWLTENASWRWVFYINLPVGVLAFYGIARYLCGTQPILSLTALECGLDTVLAVFDNCGGNQILWVDYGKPWPAVKGLELRGRDVLAPPVSGNLSGKTVVLAQYRQATGSDGHFVATDLTAALVAWSQFLETRATTGVATLVVP